MAEPHRLSGHSIASFSDRRRSGHSLTAFSEHRRSGNRWSWSHDLPTELSASQSALTATPSFPEAIELANVDEDHTNELPSGLAPIHPRSTVRSNVDNDHDNELPSGLAPTRLRSAVMAQPSEGVADGISNTSNPIQSPVTESAKPPPVRTLHGWKWTLAGKQGPSPTVRY